MTLTFALTPLAGAIAMQSDITVLSGVLPLFLSGLVIAVCSVILGRRFDVMAPRKFFGMTCSSACIGLLVALYAIHRDSYVVFCIAFIFMAIGQAGAGYARFTSAVSVAEPYRPTLVTIFSIVGLLAALTGPWLLRLGESLSNAFFLLLVIQAIVLICSLTAKGVIHATEKSKPALNQSVKSALIFSLPVNAIFGAAVSSFAMSSIMVTAPYAMGICGLTVRSAPEIFQIHYMAMFAPALFIPIVVKKFGSNKGIISGIALTMIGAAVAMPVLSYGAILLAMLLVGLGWCLSINCALACIMMETPENQRARAATAYQFSIALFSGVGAAVGGLSFDLGQWTVTGTTAIMVCLIGVVPALQKMRFERVDASARQGKR